MINRKKLFNFIVIILVLFMIGCNINKQENKDKKLKFSVDIKDKHSLDILNFFIEEYKNKNPDIEIVVNNSIGSEVTKDINNKNNSDIIVTSRNNMIQLASKGILSDLSDLYEKNNINERYYNIVTSYGRYTDKYYGISLIPYSIEFLYNQSLTKKLNTNKDIYFEDLTNILKDLNKKNISLPIVVAEDLDIYNTLVSSIVSNEVNMNKLINNYDSGINGYKNIKSMQKIFDTINILQKEKVINKNTFKLGTENSITKFVNGDIPAIICMSYYNNKFKSKNIKLIDNYVDSKNKLNIPIIVNCMLCVPINSKNIEEVNKFIEFIFSDKIQEKLVKKGFITGNKKANKNLSHNLTKGIVTHINNSNENSMIYLYNLPKKFNEVISSKINNILSGKYSGKEWDEVIKEVYP